MLCPNCGVAEAIQDRQLGVLYCQTCQIRHKSFISPKTIELTSEAIKEDRKKYAKSIVGRYRDGQLSKEFVTHYPEQAKDMVKEGIHTEKEIKNAKPVWSDIHRGVDLDKSK